MVGYNYLNKMICSNDLNYEFKFINSDIELKSLKLKIKQDTTNNNFEGCVIPKKLKSNEFVICIVNKITNDICSFIWFGIYNNIFFDISLEKLEHLHINYSYTIKKFRNSGFNKKLRLWIETYCGKNNIQYITSVPLPDSNSKYILEKLGYIKINTGYRKKINIL